MCEQASNVGCEPVKVLYIASDGRSGSTILSQVLGNLDGFVSVGELNAIWKYGLFHNFLCSCGVPFREYPFWTEVFEQAFGGFETLDAAKLIMLWHRVARFRNIPLFNLRWKPALFKERAHVYCEYQVKLYMAIQKVSGCQVIVDSSKSPTYVHLYKTLPTVDLYVLHLVRDSRAVAYSQMKTKLRPEFPDKAIYMDQMNPIKSAIRWMIYHLALMPFVTQQGCYTLVKYEDFVADPNNMLIDIQQFMGIYPLSLSLVDDHRVRLGVSHQISGNPVRFTRGEVMLREDDEWKAAMKTAHKRVVAALTWPLLAKYGYRL